MHFHYKKDSGLSLEKALSTEWLETNGLGGYSSSTITNCHTRKYHGLLVSKFDNFSDKYVLLNQVEEVIEHDGHRSFLTSHLYPDFFQEGGFSNLQEFKRNTHPVWDFKVSDLAVTKELLLLNGENTLLIKYIANSNCKITLRPLFSFRSFHKLQRENPLLEPGIEILPNGFCCTTYKGLPKLYFQTNVKHTFVRQPLWYRNFIYSKERERGYDFTEDLFSPGVITFEFGSEREMICVCSTVRQISGFPIKWDNEIWRRKNLVVSNVNKFQEQLHKVGQTFLTTSSANKNSPEVVAGYHWFLSWGRDAMISLPGLTLYSGQEDLCLAVLKTFAGEESKGLIPNYLGINKESNAYNTVDASLWFVWAVQQYYLKTKKFKEVVAYFWPTLKNIYHSYRHGALYNIKMQENGLLYVGNSNINLTWMDAVVDGKPVTSRYGYPVEVNALWYNMIGFMVGLAGNLKDPLQQELKQLWQLSKASFLETFWCEELGYLYDFVNDKEKNSALRPNQIFAVSLPHSPLLIRMAVNIMQLVTKQLLTPYGLRTLPKGEDGYCGIYKGNQAERDLAYHNGTVWPWLLGHFVEGLLKVTSDRGKVLQIINPCLEALEKHFAEYGIGSIAEIFSGDKPHKPDGCISQAWSVAEVLRLTYLLNMNKEHS